MAGALFRLKGTFIGSEDRQSNESLMCRSSFVRNTLAPTSTIHSMVHAFASQHLNCRPPHDMKVHLQRSLP